jgi:hypothetical protein
MSLDNTIDYMAAVAKRQRLERILRQEARQFSGYGRELFECGLSNTLSQLDAAISDYELRLGYTPMAPYNFWTTHIKEQCIPITGSAAFESYAPSINFPETACSTYLKKTPIEVRKEQVEVTVTEQGICGSLSSFLLPQVAPAGAQ